MRIQSLTFASSTLLMKFMFATLTNQADVKIKGESAATQRVCK